MDLTRNPSLLDKLACSYALGTLRNGARRRFEAMAREQLPVRTAALLWQDRIASLTELQQAQAPDPEVWSRIERQLHADRANSLPPIAPPADARLSTQAKPSWWNRAGWWRGATVFGIGTTLAAIAIGWNLNDQATQQVATLEAQLRAVPQDAYIAVLHDDDQSPSMLVTFDPRNRQLTLQRVGNYQESPDRTLQLWAIPPGGTPKTLGVLERNKLLRLAADESDVRDASALAISLEPLGGVPGAGGPTGPVLFSGKLIQKLP